MKETYEIFETPCPYFDVYFIYLTCHNFMQCFAFSLIDFRQIEVLVYTSEVTLCFAICVHSATRHNIHMYPYFLFAAIHHLKSSSTFSVRPRSSVGRVTVDLIRRSWVRFPTRSKDFFFTSCDSLIPFTRANAQWVIHGSISTSIYTYESMNIPMCLNILI